MNSVHYPLGLDWKVVWQLAFMKLSTYIPIILISSTVLLGSCWSRDIQQGQNLKSNNPIDVVLDVETDQPEPNYLRISGSTNMPDDFVMQLFVCRFLVDPKDAQAEKLTGSGICGASTYAKIKKVKVKDGAFYSSFLIPTVEETQKIQSNYIENNPDRVDIKMKVPWSYVSIEVDGFPNHQNDKIMKWIGGKQGANLVGRDVFQYRESYNRIHWKTKLEI